MTELNHTPVRQDSLPQLRNTVHRAQDGVKSQQEKRDAPALCTMIQRRSIQFNRQVDKLVLKRPS